MHYSAVEDYDSGKLSSQTLYPRVVVKGHMSHDAHLHNCLLIPDCHIHYINFFFMRYEFIHYWMYLSPGMAILNIPKCGVGVLTYEYHWKLCAVQKVLFMILNLLAKQTWSR